MPDKTDLAIYTVGCGNRSIFFFPRKKNLLTRKHTLAISSSKQWNNEFFLTQLLSFPSHSKATISHPLPYVDILIIIIIFFYSVQSESKNDAMHYTQLFHPMCSTKNFKHSRRIREFLLPFTFHYFLLLASIVHWFVCWEWQVLYLLNDVMLFASLHSWKATNLVLVQRTQRLTRKMESSFPMYLKQLYFKEIHLLY